MTQIEPIYETETGTSLVVQWVGLHTPDVGGPGSIPGQGTRSGVCATLRVLHATTKRSVCRN